MARILFDCDGVLSDCLAQLLRKLREYGHVTPAELTSYDFMSQLEMPAREMALLIFSDVGFWEKLPVVSVFLRGVIDAMRAEGHDVVVVTSPWLSCRGWESVRREWLRVNFDFAPQDIVFTSRKELVHGHIFIEDRAEKLNRWHDAWGGQGFLIEHSYNAHEETACKRIKWDNQGIAELMLSIPIT